MVKVGIPRALTYYRHFPFWKSLLEGLGTEVVVSKHTGKRLLDDGVSHCVDDICVPVKLFYGHVLDLADRVDLLFISRLVSVEKSESDTYTCPKLIGLPDMIKSSLSGLPPIIDFVVDVQNVPLKSSAKKLADSLGVTGARARRALEDALDTERRFQAELLRGVPPEEAIDVVLPNGGGNGSGSKAGPERTGGGDLNIALVGHEYLIFDPFISHNLPRKLERFGANVSFITQVPPAVVDLELARYPGISWSYEKELLGAASHFLSCNDIDGVMLVVGFACGPDSIISEIIEREVRTEKSPPLMTLVLDEHTGGAGVATRVEAFIDLVRRSRMRTTAPEPDPN